jgi:ABC-type Zn uptake system ZnuABC Zn-binding protein ZnuA
MTTVENIKKAVAKLTPEQLAKFRTWFEEYDAQLFDERIERDAKAGKLDKFAEDAIRAHREGRTREL